MSTTLDTEITGRLSVRRDVNGDALIGGGVVELHGVPDTGDDGDVIFDYVQELSVEQAEKLVAVLWRALAEREIALRCEAGL